MAKHNQPNENKFYGFPQKAVLIFIALLLIIIGVLVGLLMSGSNPINLSYKSNNNQEESANSFKIGKYNVGSVLDELKVDRAKFEQCLDKGETEKRVDEDFQEGAQAGIQGTPGGVIYDMQTGKSIAFPGAVSASNLETILNDLKSGKSDSGDNALKVSKPDPEKDHWKGSKTARYVLVEYSDLECPFCQRFHPEASKFVSEHEDVAWVYRHFPLRGIHPDAQKLAEGAECVYNQKGDEGFWQFVDYVFKNPAE
ncbi:MAG: hypothetical protein KatS3mg090_0936 [Patescibacteria group bacterium]|nr:MAG: hypothetical protein KatS3mg090_0936 [Patescibacteria group bacterium]